MEKKLGEILEKVKDLKSEVVGFKGKDSLILCEGTYIFK
jgi:hypothetical protein